MIPFTKWMYPTLQLYEARWVLNVRNYHMLSGK